MSVCAPQKRASEKGTGAKEAAPDYSRVVPTILKKERKEADAEETSSERKPSRRSSKSSGATATKAQVCADLQLSLPSRLVTNCVAIPSNSFSLHGRWTVSGIVHCGGELLGCTKDLPQLT